MYIKFTDRSLSLRPISSHHDKERGVVLFVALIVLVAMSLAAVSMMRAVDTGTRLAGNLATKQSAINAPDTAFNVALNQVIAMVDNGSSSGNAAITGYSAFDIVQSVNARNWASAKDLGTNTATGNRVQLLIDRICTPTRDCERTRGLVSQTEGRSYGSAESPHVFFFQHFRSIARVTDPKGAVHFVEFKND
jgi:type IV pilus assembly protein PilX